MFTRCPACSTVHPVNAAMLARGNGRFRCGKCNKVSNALESLFDDWPEAGAKPPKSGELPTLGLNVDLKQAGRTRLNPAEAKLTGEYAGEPEQKPRGRGWLRAAWIIAVLVVAMVGVAKLAEFNGTPLLGPQDVDRMLIKLGLKQAPPPVAFHDPSLIHLVSRELVSHPTQPDRLRLAVTIVNRAPRNQPYPEIEVVLIDAAGDKLATHRFGPLDYLAPGSHGRLGMSPQAYLPLTLDFEDPGVRAVGFELNFY